MISGEPPAKRRRLNHEDPGSQCKRIIVDEAKSRESVGGGLWFSFGWAEKLCKCGECMELYKSSGCEFLFDDDRQGVRE